MNEWVLKDEVELEMSIKGLNTYSNQRRVNRIRTNQNWIQEDRTNSAFSLVVMHVVKSDEDFRSTKNVSFSF